MILKAIPDAMCDRAGCREHWSFKHPAGTTNQFQRKEVKLCQEDDRVFLAVEAQLRGRIQPGPRNTHPKTAIR